MSTALYSALANEGDEGANGMTEHVERGEASSVDIRNCQKNSPYIGIQSCLLRRCLETLLCRFGGSKYLLRRCDWIPREKNSAFAFFCPDSLGLRFWRVRTKGSQSSLICAVPDFLGVASRYDDWGPCFLIQNHCQAPSNWLSLQTGRPCPHVSRRPRAELDARVVRPKKKSLEECVFP